jgi:hypothetical protein
MAAYLTTGTQRTEAMIPSSGRYHGIDVREMVRSIPEG